MKSIHPDSMESILSRQGGAPSFVFSAMTSCFTFLFGFWTLAANIVVIAHLPFQTLSRIGPFVVAAGVVCGLLTAKLAVHSKPQAQILAQLQDSPWKWPVVVAVGIVAVRAFSYPVFWIASLFFVAVSTGSLWKYRESTRGNTPPITRSASIVLMVLAISSAALTYIAHRPDADDANFVGIAADAVAHPELPVLSHDALYGGDKLPLILPTYAVDSYELFIAVLARWFSGAPIWWAHAVVPTVLAAFLPLAWAKLMRSVIPRQWLAATLVTLMLLALLGEAHYSLGNFAFVRLFQGKAVLASIGIPLLYSYAWRFAETGSVWDWVMLACCTIACVGFSAAGLFVVPMALGTAAIAGWGKGPVWRVVLGIVPSTYPLAWGLALRGSFNAVAGVFASVHRTSAGTVSQVFGAHGQYVLLAALLAGPFLTRAAHSRFRLTLTALIYFLVPLNPFLFKFISRLTTPESVWRILWIVPVVGIVAVAMVNAVEQAMQTWGKRGMIIAVFVVLCVFAWLAPHSSLRKSNGVTFSASALKVPASDWETARSAVALTPPTTALLAPEPVATWVPTVVDRPPLVSVREIYDDQMAVRMPPEEARARRELRELVSGGEFSSERTEELLGALPYYRVGLVVATSPAATRLKKNLTARGYSLLREQNHYFFFASSVQGRGATLSP